MTQNRYSVLVGLFLLIVLTGSFFLAGRVVLDKAHNSIAAANATSTPTAVPPDTVTPRPTSATRIPSHPSNPPTSTPAPGVVKVYIAGSNNISAAADTLPADTGTFFCMVTLPDIPLSTPITFKWQSLPSGTGIFNYTNPYSTAYKYTYVSGPFSPGQYRCEVSAPINGTMQILGTKTFTVG